MELTQDSSRRQPRLLLLLLKRAEVASAVCWRGTEGAANPRRADQTTRVSMYYGSALCSRGGEGPRKGHGRFHRHQKRLRGLITITLVGTKAG